MGGKKYFRAIGQRLGSYGIIVFPSWLSGRKTSYPDWAVKALVKGNQDQLGINKRVK